MDAKAEFSSPADDNELEWISLREDLDNLRRKDEWYFRDPYKDNWMVKTGLTLTVFSFIYTICNMNSAGKFYRGLGLRIFFQSATIGTLGVGYFQYIKSEEYAEKEKYLEGF